LNSELLASMPVTPKPLVCNILPDWGRYWAFIKDIERSPDFDEFF